MPAPRSRISLVCMKLPFINLALLLLVVATAAEAGPRLQVDGRRILDPCGEAFVPRGANNLIIYHDPFGETTLPGLGKSGANTVRAHWAIYARQPEPHASPADLDRFITTAWEHNLFSVISLWDAGGDRTPDNQWHDVIVRWWTSPEIVAVVRKHEPHLIVNIANEWDRDDMPDQEFRRRVAAAVREMRAAGIRTPIMIDADGYGRNGDGLVDNARYLLAQDPDRNLIFSWHYYDRRMDRGDIVRLFDRAVDSGTCFFVGEFSRTAAVGEPKLAWEALIEEAAKRDIGWLAWDWGSRDPDQVAKFSITTDNQFGNFANPPWGEAIAVTHPDGLGTTKRTHFQTHATCAPGSGYGLPDVPTAPTGLRMQESLGASVTLSWVHDLRNVENFDIEVRDAPGNPWRIVRTVDAQTTAIIGFRESLFADVGLHYDSHYEARVIAVNAGGRTPSTAIPIRTGPRPSMTGGGNGLRMAIYDHSELDGFFENRVDVTWGSPIDNDWGDGGPHKEAGTDGFGVLFSGLLVPPLDGDYTFTLHCDDAAEVRLDGLMIWDNWGKFSKKVFNKASFRVKELQAGRPYALEVRYAEVDGPARIRLEWAHPAIVREPVPVSQLYLPVND